MSMNRVFSSVFLAVVLLALTINPGAKAFPLDHNDTPRSFKRDIALMLHKPSKNPEICTYFPGYHQPSNPTKQPVTPVVEPVKPTTKPPKYPTPPKGPTNSTHEPQKPTECRKNPKARLPQSIKPEAKTNASSLMEKWEIYNYYK